MAIHWDVILLFMFYFITVDCKVHEAFFSGDCKKATAFCKHQCINIDKGFVCKCHPGYKLLKDGQSCSKIPGWIEPIHVNTHLHSPEQSSSYKQANNQIDNNQQTLHSHTVIQESDSSDHNVVLGVGPPMAIMRPPSCQTTTCQNGGHCVVKQNDIKCNCPLGFGGHHCEKNVPVKYPRFVGDGYMAFPVLTDSYKTFEVELEFRPDSMQGLLLFSGEKTDAESDFFSVALVDGYVEFRFDCGTGMAKLKSREKVNAGEWNVVKVKRSSSDGYLYLNDQKLVQGKSQGAYTRLTLRLKLFLGGYIDMSFISERVGVTQSFSGCIQKLKINNKLYDMRQVGLFGHAEIGQNVGECSQNVCTAVVCQNGGVCRASSADQHVCLCPLGWAGELCQKGVEVHIPHFSGHSFVKHPGLGRSSLSFTEVEIVFKPMNRDGLMFYNGYTNDRKGDFISIAMREGYIEFQFDLGTGPGVLRSVEPVTLDQWHHVKVSRTGLQAVLQVDNQNKVEGNSEGAFTQLTLLQDLYIGGHDNFDQVSQQANLSTSYYGCIQKVIINGRPLHVISDAIDGINVDNCEHPCVGQPCLNGGECEPDHDVYICHCLLGYTNTNCEDDIEDKTYIPYFTKNSYLIYTDNEIMKRVNGNKIDVQMLIKPVSWNGLILWTGKNDLLTSSSDFFVLGFKDGALELRYNLGSGEAVIMYNMSNLFDGHWHSIRIQRDKQDAFIMVDNSQVVEGSSPGSYTILNTDQILYIGGMPSISHKSMQKFTSGLVGCIKDIMLAEEYQFDLIEKAQGGSNIGICQE